MTMRTASEVMSPCEILRKINDLCQGNNSKDNEIRMLCAEGEKKTKKIARELNEHNEEVWRYWWDENEKWRDELEKRLSDDYLQEGSLGPIGKIDNGIDKL